MKSKLTLFEETKLSCTPLTLYACILDENDKREVVGEITSRPRSVDSNKESFSSHGSKQYTQRVPIEQILQGKCAQRETFSTPFCFLLKIQPTPRRTFARFLSVKRCTRPAHILFTLDENDKTSGKT